MVPWLSKKSKDQYGGPRTNSKIFPIFPNTINHENHENTNIALQSATGSVAKLMVGFSISDEAKDDCRHLGFVLQGRAKEVLYV